MANPEDIIQFTKLAAKKVTKKGENKKQEDDAENMLEGNLGGRPEIHNLVDDILLRKAGNMSILNLKGLADSVAAYVDKKDLTSIETFLSSTLEGIRLDIGNTDVQTSADIDIEMARRRDREEAKAQRAQDRAEGCFPCVDRFAGGLGCSGCPRCIFFPCSS